MKTVGYTLENGKNIFTFIEERLPIGATPIKVKAGEYLFVNMHKYVVNVTIDEYKEGLVTSFYQLRESEFIRETECSLYKYYKYVRLGLLIPIPYTDVSKWKNVTPTTSRRIFTDVFDNTFI